MEALPAKTAPCMQRSSGRGVMRETLSRDSRVSAKVSSSAMAAARRQGGVDHLFVRESVACDPRTLALRGQFCRLLPRHRATLRRGARVQDGSRTANCSDLETHTNRITPFANVLAARHAAGHYSVLCRKAAPRSSSQDTRGVTGWESLACSSNTKAQSRRQAPTLNPAKVMQ